MRNGIGVCVLASLICVSLTGCGSSGDGASSDSASAASAEQLRRATAWVNPTADHQGGGSAIFIREGETITLQLTLEQLAGAGIHAVHLHEKGDCSAPDATSAGGHWNPGGHDHGEWGTPPHHMGDVGNITVAEDGTGELTFATDMWTLGGGAENDILGKAVIVHAGPDDFTSQPTGAAGGRIACGVIKK